MQNKFKLKLFYLIIALVALVSLSSCDEDNFYDRQLVGRWECVSFQDYAISSADYHVYNNFADHTGYLEAYDDFGIWSRYNYHWYTRSNSIVIDWYDSFEPVEYFYDFSRGFLYLTDPYDTYRFWSYRFLY